MPTPESLLANPDIDALFHHGAPTQIDYVPTADVGPGVVLAHGGIWGVTNRAITYRDTVTSKDSDNYSPTPEVAVGALAIGGVWLLYNPSDAVAFAAGDRVGWDDTNKKALATVGDGWIGEATVAIVAGTEYVVVKFLTQQDTIA